MTKAYYHLPGLFEFYELYSRFLPIYRDCGEFFYEWCEIGSIYGAPADCIWGGGRVGFGDDDPRAVADLLARYGIPARLTFSNSLITKEHLSDGRCNRLCRLFENRKTSQEDDRTKAGAEAADIREYRDNGIIIYSDMLMEYLQSQYPGFYYVSSVTKVLTDFRDFERELNRSDFRYVVPDFRLNGRFDRLRQLDDVLKDKVEFLCNECCSFTCADRKRCYENVSRKNLGEDCPDYPCNAPDAAEGYRFSRAMQNPGFIGTNDIVNTYLPMGFSNFKIEGRSLGSAVVFEMLLYYMIKPEYRLRVREMIYLDGMLDLF